MNDLAFNIDPRKLIYFASVVEVGSLKKASSLLHVSQPALSASMDRLEAAVGTKLLRRGPTGVEPTTSGELLYPHARLIRDELARAALYLRERDNRGAVPLRVASLPSLGRNIIPNALRLWRKSHPRAGLRILEEVQIDLLQGLLRREIDIAFGTTLNFDIEDGLKQRVIFRDTLCVVAGPRHPLRAVADLGWQQLVQYPWISTSRGRQGSVLEDILNDTGVSAPPQLTVCGAVSLVLPTIQNSDSLVLLPAHTIESELNEGRLCCLPITHARLRRSIAVFVREGYQLQGPALDLVEQVQGAGLNACREPEPALDTA